MQIWETKNYYGWHTLEGRHRLIAWGWRTVHGKFASLEHLTAKAFK